MKTNTLESINKYSKIKTVIDAMDKPIEKLLYKRVEWGTN